MHESESILNLARKKITKVKEVEIGIKSTLDLLNPESSGEEKGIVALFLLPFLFKIPPSKYSSSKRTLFGENEIVKKIVFIIS